MAWYSLHTHWLMVSSVLRISRLRTSLFSAMSIAIAESHNPVLEVFRALNMAWYSLYTHWLTRSSDVNQFSRIRGQDLSDDPNPPPLFDNIKSNCRDSHLTSWTYLIHRDMTWYYLHTHWLIISSDSNQLLRIPRSRTSPDDPSPHSSLLLSCRDA